MVPGRTKEHGLINKFALILGHYPENPSLSNCWPKSKHDRCKARVSEPSKNGGAN
jgi:hypothetical protein